MSASISVAMIVKDEAADLPACISNLRPLVDEICIVDTGSSDGTPELAQALADRCTRIPWPNDFSVARNASIALCSGEWVYIADADERLDPAQRELLRDHTRAVETSAYRVMTRNYTRNEEISDFQSIPADDPHAQGFPGWYPSYKVRLFPRRSTIRFSGEVHELVEPSLAAAGVRIVNSPLTVHHYPERKSLEQLRAKQANYIKLGLAKIDAFPTDAKAYAEVGHQYSDMGDYVKAATYLRDSLRIDGTRPDLFKDLGGVLCLLGRDTEAIQALKIAVRMDDTMPDAWRNLGIASLRTGDAQTAIESFQRALTLKPSWTDGHRHLALALDAAGRLLDALNVARHALELQPHSDQAQSLVKSLLNRVGQTT